MKENKNYHRFCLWLVTTIMLAGQSLPVSAQTVLESIQKTGILKVAIREDAPPFGYVNSADNLQGYCLDFLALLEAKLTQKLQRNTLAITLLKSTASNRFDLVNRGVIYLECGPNTIRELSETKTTFSRPFFVAGTQFLVAQDRVNEFDFADDLAGVDLGVIRNTSTEELIKERYPEANLVLFSGVTARNRGVQAVVQGKIAAMVSDGILLRAEAARDNLLVNEYVLLPEPPLTKDYYGLIITGEDAEWKDFVDSVILSQESQQLFEQWFNFVESFPLSDEITDEE